MKKRPATRETAASVARARKITKAMKIARRAFRKYADTFKALAK
jgi:hypothetical protein